MNDHVIVVGAGMGGLVSALLMAQRGVQRRLFTGSNTDHALGV